MNNVSLVGRLSEIKTSQVNDGTVAKGSIGVSAPGGTLDWIEVEAWNALATTLSTYGQKNKYIALSGRMKPYEFLVSDGSKRKGVKVIITAITLVAGKEESAPQQTPSNKPSQLLPAQEFGIGYTR